MKNMLAGIIGNLFVAKRKIDADSPAINAIANAEQIAESATNMVKQLLSFSRKDGVNIYPFSFTTFIRDAVKLAQISIPENILLTFRCCDEQLMLRGDSTQLQQILMNLFNNARNQMKSHCANPIQSSSSATRYTINWWPDVICDVSRCAYQIHVQSDRYPRH